MATRNKKGLAIELDDLGRPARLARPSGYPTYRELRRHSLNSRSSFANAVRTATSAYGG
jgi:hypothetical protein